MSRREFLAELAKGKKWERHVRDRLRAEGIPAEVDEDAEDDPTHDYGGQVDVVAGGTYGIEVKSQQWEWQGLEDFPHSHALGIKVSRWRRMEVKPIAVVHVSRPTGGMIVSPSSSFPRWIIRPMRDTLDGQIKDCYLTPVEFVKPFAALVDYLRNALDLPSTAIDRYEAAPQELEDSPLYCKPHQSHYCPCCKPWRYDPLDKKDAEYIRGWEAIAPIVPLTGGN